VRAWGLEGGCCSLWAWDGGFGGGHESHEAEADLMGRLTALLMRPICCIDRLARLCGIVSQLSDRLAEKLGYAQNHAQLS